MSRIGKQRMRATALHRTLLRAVSSAALLIAAALVVLPQQAGAEPGPVRSDTTNRRAKARSAVRSFTSVQTDNQRVLSARLEKKYELKKLFREKGLSYPAAETFYRIFKRERVLEVWVRGTADRKLTLLKTYSICALAGKVGPKRAQGDNQTPEGLYYIDGFNPSSEYHLSLHIDYPNKSDQLLSKAGSLGGDIFIHGGCKTEGCLAVTDDAIKELYWLTVEAVNAGQSKVPVHIFPARLTDNALTSLTSTFDKQPELKRFWANLKTSYDYFETTRTVPNTMIDERGRYRLLPNQPKLAIMDSLMDVKMDTVAMLNTDTQVKSSELSPFQTALVNGWRLLLRD